MSISVHCPKGHRLVANDDHAGKAGRCPVCKAMVSIPLPHSDYLSETAIMGILSSPTEKNNTNANILDEFAAMTGHSAKNHPPHSHEKLNHSHEKLKLCPSCDREIDTGYHICPHCHTYISTMSDF